VAGKAADPARLFRRNIPNRQFVHAHNLGQAELGDGLLNGSRFVGKVYPGQEGQLLTPSDDASQPRFDKRHKACWFQFAKLLLRRC
jgi:hypothetical protein